MNVLEQPNKQPLIELFSVSNYIIGNIKKYCVNCLKKIDEHVCNEICCTLHFSKFNTSTDLNINKSSQ